MSNKLTALADCAYNAMHCPDEANRIEAVTALLAGCGVNGRRIAEHLGIETRRPVVIHEGQQTFQWSTGRDHAATYRARKAKAAALGTTVARQYPRKRRRA